MAKKRSQAVENDTSWKSDLAALRALPRSDPERPKNESVEAVMQALDAGSATEGDLVHVLLVRSANGALYNLNSSFEGTSPSQVLFNRVKKMVRDEEFARDSDTPGEFTAGVDQADCDGMSGLPALVTLLRLLGKKGFQISLTRKPKLTRAAVRTRMVKRSRPSPDDTQAAFDAEISGLIEASVLTKARILELGFLAPRWLPFVSRYFQDQGPLQEAFTWIMRRLFFPTLSYQDYESFAKLHNGVGADVFDEMLTAVGNVSETDSVKELPQLIDALRGRLDPNELIAGVRDKHRDKDALLLGLLPLKEGKDRIKDLVDRAAALWDFYEWASKRGVYSEGAPTSEARAALEQLKVLAGYPVELSIAWFLTDILALQAAELPKQERDAVFMDGESKVTVSSAASSLRLQVQTKRAELKRHLEMMMVQSDSWTSEEFQRLMSNGVIAPLLSALLFIETKSGRCGYPDPDGAALRDYAGTLMPIPANTMLRLAHPADLEQAGTWAAWKTELESSGRQQPFPQILRDLYSPQPGESSLNHRFLNQSFSLDKAVRLLNTLLWAATDDEAFRPFGEVQAVFEFQQEDQDESSEYESEDHVIGKLRFHSKEMDRHHPTGMAFNEVPPIAFSETILDAQRIVGRRAPSLPSAD